ncbi:MAG: DUF4248 domain-containing protein [Bacteroides sp.]|nr:DUF4248 domain-containing protein [Bacteroides sp.]
MKKNELALLYFPESTPKVATRHLMRWINGCQPLMEELKLAGYDPMQKLFTVRQVILIYHHLGNPD